MNPIVQEQLVDASISAAMSGGIVSGIATTAGTAIFAGLATTAILLVPAIALCVLTESFFSDDS